VPNIAVKLDVGQSLMTRCKRASRSAMASFSSSNFASICPDLSLVLASCLSFACRFDNLSGHGSRQFSLILGPERLSNCRRRRGRTGENKREIGQIDAIGRRDEAIAISALYNEVSKKLVQHQASPQYGHVQYAAAISVDVEGGTLYTSDWAAFLAAEAKVKDEFGQRR